MDQIGFSAQILSMKSINYSKDIGFSKVGIIGIFVLFKY